MIQRSFYVELRPEQGLLQYCVPVGITPSWYPDVFDDPDTHQWSTLQGGTMYYSGWAVRALCAQLGGTLDPKLLIDPWDLQSLFDSMGWSPDHVWVQAAVRFGRQVFAIVGTAG